MEQVFSTSRRGFSARSIFMFVATVFITALLWVTFGSHVQTHAAGPVANWKSGAIIYDGHQYNANSPAAKGNTLGLPENTQYYTYAPDSGSNSTGVTAKTVRANVIYFAPGVDPPSATSATFIQYDYLPSKGYSNPGNKTSITVTPDGKQNSLDACSVSNIGWIICPVTVFMANGMDFIFHAISTFMAVQPVTVGDTTSSLYTAWNTMRTIANVAFIIVFLIIIYSQLTNAGVSNYGIKKMLPRLIVASILVNLSYIICSLAVDVSNILGYSLQEVLVQIRQNTFSITNDTWSASTNAWTTVTAAVLGGVGIGALIANPGVLFLLVPVLVGAILTALFVLLILAARQAIIVIMIILAPLAFVAYLLPNTEQWFKKWRELMTTMLIFFPAFSIVFGGSQLASSIILQNATTMMMVVVGLAVQVAPLVITPIILRFSGSLLGRVAGIINNPQKGLLDRSKNWANARVDKGKQAMYANPKTKNPFRRVAQRMAYNDRAVKNDTEMYKAEAEDWMSRRDITTKQGQRTQVRTSMAKLSTEGSHHEMSQAMEEARAGNGDKLSELLLSADPNLAERVRARFTPAEGDTREERRESRAANAESYRDNRLGKRYEFNRDEEGNIKRKEDGTLDTNTAYAKYIDSITARAVKLDQHTRVVETATNIAKNKQLTNYATQVQDNEHIRVEAGGIGGLAGQQGALAAAFKASANAHNDAVANAGSILNRYNFTDDITGKIALGEANIPGVTFPITSMIKEAAILKIAGGANGGELQRLLENIEIDASAENQDFRQAFADTLQSNGARPKYAGAKIIADIKRGRTADGSAIPAPGPERIQQYVIETVNADKYGAADVLVTQDRDYIETLKNTIANGGARGRMDLDKQATLLRAISTAKSDPLYSGKIGERKSALDEIERILSADGGVLDELRKQNAALAESQARINNPSSLTDDEA